MAPSANRLGYQTLNLETLGSNPAGATNGEVVTLDARTLEIESVLTADSISSPSKSKCCNHAEKGQSNLCSYACYNPKRSRSLPFEQLPKSVGAKEISGFIAAFLAIDDEVLRKKFDDCVMWSGAGSTDRCGVIRRRGIDGRIVTKTPWRYMWEQVNKQPVPEGMEVGHICTSPKHLCVNPNHLFAGTREAVCIMHSAQGRLKKVKKTHCLKGHLIAGENEFLYWRKNGAEFRCCRICRNRVARNGHRRRNGAKARVKREHPDMSRPDEKCKQNLHLMTYENTAVYFNKSDNRWNGMCRMCANKRYRMNQRMHHGYKPINKYADEAVYEWQRQRNQPVLEEV